MKTTFSTKKIIKISAVAIFSVFILFSFNFGAVKAAIDSNLAEQEIKKRNTNNENSSGNFTYTLLQPLPAEGKPLNENVTLTEYLTWIYRFALAMAGFLAVLMIIIGGVEYIASGANEKLRSDAHSRIENALWGLALALAAYLILYTINPKLVNFESNKFFETKETTNFGGQNSGTFEDGDVNLEERGSGSSSGNIRKSTGTPI